LICLKISLIDSASWTKIEISSSRWLINLYSLALMWWGMIGGVSSMIRIGSSSRYSSRENGRSGEETCSCIWMNRLMSVRRHRQIGVSGLPYLFYLDHGRAKNSRWSNFKELEI
jgi:hypothetical protein